MAAYKKEYIFQPFLKFSIVMWPNCSQWCEKEVEQFPGSCNCFELFDSILQKKYILGYIMWCCVCV